jgi:hypothetical protein
MFIIAQPIYMLVLRITINVLLCFKCCRCLLRPFQARYKSITWNGFIRFYSNNYLVFSMIGWISMTDLRFGKSYLPVENFNSQLGVTLFTFSLSYPIFLVPLLYCKFKPFYHPINKELFAFSIYEIDDLLNRQP